MNMEFDSLDRFRASPGAELGKGPFAVLVAEDSVALNNSLEHLRGLGFKAILIVAPVGMDVPAAPKSAKRRPPPQFVIRHPSRQSGAAEAVVNALIDKVPGVWIHYCYNGEFLFYPFCEDRTVGELVTWVMEERRDAVLSYVIDLYAGDLTTHPDAVDLDGALLDSSGYYAETRMGGPDGKTELDRQMDFFGGLRWRFEEHVPKPKRRIDRVALFRAKRGLRLGPDHRLNDEEMNTYACPWHHSLTATICSFRVAKALRTNPGSRHDISDFRWHKSEQFHWSSMQLMELGLMEPGQWF
ncbi:hypothetical protein V8J82_10140 [Gymnodinialimonas sp. 2305UL16-5]|uniref:hypothetical protein n=1 Tax=Gymnodinialimonas mytili TaxID=3126503 RepID=UPI0030ABEF4C